MQNQLDLSLDRVHSRPKKIKNLLQKSKANHTHSINCGDGCNLLAAMNSSPTHRNFLPCIHSEVSSNYAAWIYRYGTPPVRCDVLNWLETMSMPTSGRWLMGSCLKRQKIPRINTDPAAARRSIADLFRCRHKVMSQYQCWIYLARSKSLEEALKLKNSDSSVTCTWSIQLESSPELLVCDS